MITILCSGSRGDYQPYVALAQQLKKLGKPVRIAGGKSFESYITSYDIDFYPLSLDYLSMDIDPKLIKDAQSSDNPLKMLLTFNKMKNLAVHMTEEMYQACQGSELLIYHPGCTIAYFASLEMGIPSVLASPFPMHKTREVASLITYGKSKMPKPFSYQLLQGMLWMAGKTGIKAFYKKKDGKLPKNFGSPFERTSQNQPAIASCSEHVFPRPNDWSPHIHQYGYWFVEEHNDYVPSTELNKFLSEGDKPIYFGFGSVFDEKHSEETIQIVVGALKATGKRGIISGMGTPKHLPENVLAIDSVPHSWLFDQVSMVCHHGGAGTTAAGFRAGVPSLIVPFSNDQFAWAHRAYDIGVGAYPIYRKQLTVEKLAVGITNALEDTIISNAKKLGQQIAQENGAHDCAQLIVSLCK